MRPAAHRAKKTNQFFLIMITKEEAFNFPFNFPFQLKFISGAKRREAAVADRPPKLSSQRSSRPTLARNHRVRALSHATRAGLTNHHLSPPVPVHAGPWPLASPVCSFLLLPLLLLPLLLLPLVVPEATAG